MPAAPAAGVTQGRGRLRPWRAEQGHSRPARIKSSRSETLGERG